MSNDSTHGRAVGTHPGSFSGGEYCRWTSWAQTDSDALCARSGTHRDDRAASVQPKQAAHARSAKVKPLHATLARRALLRLASMAAPDPHSLGVPHPELL